MLGWILCPLHAQKLYPDVNDTGYPMIAPESPRNPSGCRTPLAMAASLAIVLIATHWPTLGTMAERWMHDPQYSHGFIVPIFALVVLWFRRDRLAGVTWEPSWLGLPLLAVGIVLRFIAVRADFDPLYALSLLPTAFGLVLLVGGRSFLGWSWPALAFLAFMLPLPFTLETALALPLRRVATEMSTYSLQTLGLPAIAEGNVILVEDMKLGVEEACSGLGMLMTFFALATALAMIVRAPLTDRFILIASAIPIAILANVIRITATGVAYYFGGKDSPVAEVIYHDLAGWLMMPLALAMLWGELKLLQRLFVEEADDTPLSLTMRPNFSPLPLYS